APVLIELRPRVGPEERLRITDVDRQKHRRERIPVGAARNLRALELSRLARSASRALVGQSSSEPSDSPIFSASASAVRLGSSPSPRSSSTVTSLAVHGSARGMIRVGRFLSQTATSSIFRRKDGYAGCEICVRSSLLQ